MGKASVIAWFEGGGKQVYNVNVRGHKEIFLPRSFIELAKPVQRCEPDDPSILECVMISPTQLQLNQVNNTTLLGKTFLTTWDTEGNKQIYDIHVKGIEVALNKIEILKFEFPGNAPHKDDSYAPTGSVTGSKDLPETNQTLRITPIIADKERRYHLSWDCNYIHVEQC